MNIKKVILAGLAVTVFDAIFGMVFCGGIFNWVYQLEPTNVWRPMDAGPPWHFFLGSFACALILAFVYALLKDGVPGASKLKKGLIFGLCVWAVGMLPGMFATYAFMTVNTTVVIYWTILGFIQIPLDGLIIAFVYGE